MSQSYGPHFPTQGINPGHIHRDTSVSPARAYMYKGGDPTNTAANWTELDLADTPDIFVKKSEGTGGILVTSIPTSGIVSLMKMMSRILSHGVISGGTIADNGDGTVTVAAGEGTIRPTDNKLDDLVYAIWEQSDPIAIPTNDNKQIVVDYNSGSPQIIAVDDYATEAERRDRIYLGEVHNASGVLTIDHDPEIRGDFTHLMQEWAEQLIGIRVASGESVSETGTRNLIITAGVMWGRHFDDHDTPAVDTSGAGTFIAFYRSATPGQYTRVTGQTQWDNTQYDDGSGTLATLTGGTYGVHFLMRLVDGKVGLLYGRAEYATQALAEAAAQPADMPYEFHSTHAAFIARIVFLKSAASLATIMDIRPIIGGTSGSGGSSSISLPLAVNQGGTGATTAAAARTNLATAASGANTDIESLGGLTTPLSVAQGGTAAITAAAARTSLSVSGGSASFYYPTGTDHILIPTHLDTLAATLTMANGTAVGIPVYFEKGQTLSALIIEVTTAQAGTGIKMAMYSANANGTPNALLVDAGTIDCSTTGIKTLVISTAVSKGMYWLVLKSDSNTVVIRGVAPTNISCFLGTLTTNMSTFRTGLRQAIGYAAAWADPFGAVTYVGTTMPLIGFQLSA